jgi:ankyrin repeat protein
MAHIIELINNNKWDDALDEIKNDMFKPIIDQRNLFHMACIRGNKKIINHFLSTKSALIYQADEDGNTGAHLLAQNGWDDLLLTIASKYPDFLILKNNEDKLVINFLISRNEILNKIFKLIQKKHLNYVRSDNKTFLIDLIDNDKISLLTDKELNWSIPKEQPPLIYMIEQNKIDLCLKLLEKLDLDVNIFSLFQKTPLIMAVTKNETLLVKKLIENGANVNYGGPENTYIPINIAIKNRSIDIVDLLTRSDINFDKKDDLLNTPIYYLIDMIVINRDLYNSSDNRLKNLFHKFVKKSNLLSKNINNMTPLHLMAKYNLWEDMKDILENKKIDISILDRQRETILSYVDNCKVDKFIGFMDKTPLVLSPRENVSLPVTVDSNHGLFNSDTVHNIIYTLYILNTYKNVIIPFQCFIDEKRDWEKQLIISNDPTTQIIASSLNLHYTYFYSFLPYLLYWRDKNIYYKTKNLVFYIQRALNIKNMRFIILKFSLLPQTASMHANIVIYDKEKNTVIRFEPYGDWEILDSYNLDKMIAKTFQAAVGGKKIKYLRPGDYLKNPKFQTASTGDIKKNLGDPIGYCLAWCFWFIELKLQNPDIDEKTLVDTALEDMILNNKNSENPILDYIRGYARKLDDEKNKILKEIGFTDSELYELTYTPAKLEKIQSAIHNMIGRILKKN